MSSPTQSVTIVSSGGTMVQLANQRGAPYPTTGHGALVFGTGAHLTDPVIEGDFTYNGDLTVAVDLLVNGDTLLKGDLTVEDDTLLKGDLDVEGNGQIAGNLTVNGNIHFGGTLTGPAGPITSAGGGTLDLDTATGHTVDTGEVYRLIMLSNGTVRALPNAAVPPLPPTGLTITVRLTSINLTWNIVPGATSFVIKRDGVEFATTVYQSYRDTTVVIGHTYSYTVSSVDQYQQRSTATVAVTGTITSSLNTAPADVVISCYPLPIPTDGPALVRVNGREIDTQNIAYTLGVDAGSLTATYDPSVWVLRI